MELPVTCQLLTGKLRFIVTAGVHQGLDSGREPLLVTFWHWPGISPYTSPYGFAETCVFDKQSLELFCCGSKAPRKINPRGP